MLLLFLGLFLELLLKIITVWFYICLAFLFQSPCGGGGGCGCAGGGNGCGNRVVGVGNTGGVDGDGEVYLSSSIMINKHVLTLFLHLFRNFVSLPENNLPYLSSHLQTSFSSPQFHVFPLLNISCLVILSNHLTFILFTC